MGRSAPFMRTRISKRVLSPLRQARRSAGQGMPLPQYVLEDRLQLEGSIAAARVQAAHFGKCDSAVCLRRGCGQVLFGQSNMERERVHLLPNGIDLELFAPNGQAADEEKAARGIAADRLIIGHVARFHEVKNHAFLLKLAAHLKERGVRFQLVLAGDGPLRGEIEEEARQQNLLSDVLFLGTEERIHELMRTFDVFVMPSLYEGLPVVLVEAQASGLPCIISDSITEKVDAGLGLVTRLSLSEPISVWAETIARAAAAGRPKREFIKETLAQLGYDAQQNVGALLNVYNISTEKDHNR